MKIVIMEASSGLGAELASSYFVAGHEVACAARARIPTRHFGVGELPEIKPLN